MAEGFFDDREINNILWDSDYMNKAIDDVNNRKHIRDEIEMSGFRNNFSRKMHSRQNVKLREMNAELQSKLNKLTKAYRKLEADNRSLKAKLTVKKQEKRSETINNIKKFFLNIGSDFNKWLHS